VTNNNASFTPVEHYCMALVLAAVAEGHRQVNVGEFTRAQARRVANVGRLLSDLGLALEMTVPRKMPSPYLRDYAVLPPETNEDLIALLKNGVGATLEGRASPKIIKLYYKTEDPLRLVPRPLDLDQWGNQRWQPPSWGDRR
jgi:hypothetical protein